MTVKATADDGKVTEFKSDLVESIRRRSWIITATAAFWSTCCGQLLQN